MGVNMDDGRFEVVVVGFDGEVIEVRNLNDEGLACVLAEDIFDADVHGSVKVFDTWSDRLVHEYC